MSLLLRLVVATACPSTHHRLAMDALLQLRCTEAEDWRRLFLNYYEGYLRGAKAPDVEFKDFKNHVLHVREGYWGGAVGAAQLWYDRMVLALRREYWADGIYAAGVLSHYVTDPFMPLHTGQTEEEGKVHRAVEWSITKSYDELRELVAQQGGFPTVVVPEGSAWLGTLIKQGAAAANEHYEAVLEHYHLAKGVQDPLLGMDAELKQRMARQIALAVSTLARIFDRAIAEARVRPPMVELVVETLLATVKMPLRRILQRLDDAEAREDVEAIYEEVRTRGKAVDSLPEDDAKVRELHCEQVLRIPLKQLDATPARPTGLKHRAADTARARGGRPHFAWDGPAMSVDTGSTLSGGIARRGGSTLYGSSTSGLAGGIGSDASRRVVVPSSRLPGLQSNKRTRHRRRRYPYGTTPPTARSGAARDAANRDRLDRQPAYDDASDRHDSYDAPRLRADVPRLTYEPPARERDNERDADDEARSNRRDASLTRLESAADRGRANSDRIQDREQERRRGGRNDDEQEQEHEYDHESARGKRGERNTRAEDADRDERLNDRREHDDDGRDARRDERSARNRERLDEQDESEVPARSRRPWRIRRHLQVNAARAARAMKRGVQKGIVMPASALGRAVKNVAQKVRRRRPEENTSDAATDDADRDSVAAKQDAPRKRTDDRPSRSSNDGALKFFLEESHPIVDAPSIGGKTARRLEAAGIQTVADLLKADPESLAAQLDVHWIDADKVVQWQNEAELVCRVPQLRGHDAQVLAAVGVTSAEDLASLDSDSLWELVEPFLGSPQAEAILRGGRKPDREEVDDWLRWARSRREG